MALSLFLFSGVCLVAAIGCHKLRYRLEQRRRIARRIAAIRIIAQARPAARAN
jgi:hypothetical protein